jgi:hypothetical protein
LEPCDDTSSHPHGVYLFFFSFSLLYPREIHTFAIKIIWAFSWLAILLLFHHATCGMKTSGLIVISYLLSHPLHPAFSCWNFCSFLHRFPDVRYVIPPPHLFFSFFHFVCLVAVSIFDSKSVGLLATSCIHISGSACMNVFGCAECFVFACLVMDGGVLGASWLSLATWKGAGER